MTMPIPARLFLFSVALVGEAVLIPVVGIGAIFIIAEEAGVSQSTTLVGAVIGGFTLMSGLMAWVVKYLLGTTIPGIQTSHKEAIQELSASHHSSLQEVTSSHQKIMAQLTETYAKAAEMSQQTLQMTQKSFTDTIKATQDGFRSDILQRTEMSIANENQLRDLFEKKLERERQFFETQLQQLLAEQRLDRERMFDTLVTHAPPRDDDAK